MKPRRWILAAALLLAFPGAAAATHLDGFVFTFPTAPGSDVFSTGWTYQGPAIVHQETSTWSGNYFGDFEEEELRFQALDMLELSALPPGQAYLSFDLLLTGDWRGDAGYLGPAASDFTSFFKVVANGQTLLDTTFSTDPFIDQGFPGPAGSGNYGGTGAVCCSAFLQVYPQLSMTFQLTPFFPDCCTDVDITFSARFGPGYDLAGVVPGSWGIDNFVVSSTPIPEPATGALLGVGLLLLTASRRRRAGPRL
jgi:hypothetical protein